ncbi:MAG: peptidoglycan-binding domain-containing protein [Candidatus Paceibacterota bacterium]
MKKVLFSTGVAFLALAAVVGAQGYSFNSNLTVGSTGADVVTLQTALMSAGFNIPSIASGAAAKGYFGSQTQAAVKLYQASHGVPNTGFVGPLTRAALNGGAVATGPVMSCPAGYVCTPVAGTVPVSVGTIGTPGIAGSLAVTLQGSPSGASLDKGEVEDIARYKLQASASDQQLTSISLDFDNRLWLYAGSITIRDDSGAVVASKNGLNSSDFTELTVGSSYRLQLPAGYVVARTQTRFLTVSVSMLPVTDRTSATLTLTNAQFRSVDGTGVTSTDSDSSDRTFSYTGTNTGDVVSTVNSSSPLQKLVQISNSSETNDVVLNVFDLKSQNRDALLRTLSVYVNTEGTSVNTLFSRIKLRVGGTTYVANTVNVSTLGNTTASSTATFTDLNISLPKDQYVSFTVLVDVAKPATTGALDGKIASSSVKANAANVVIEDSTYNSVVVTAATLTGNDQTFSASAGNVSNTAFAISDPGSNSTGRLPTTLYTGSFSLSAGNTGLYISKTPSTAFATSSGSSVAVASSTMSTFAANNGAQSGDTSTFFYVAPGSARSFSIGGSINNTNGTATTKSLGVTAVYFTDDVASAQKYTINYGLEGLNSNLAKGVLLGTQTP